MITRPFFACLVAILLGSGLLSVAASPLLWLNVAWADDDDDGGGGDDGGDDGSDDDDDDGGSSGGGSSGGGSSGGGSSGSGGNSAGSDDDDDNGGARGSSGGGRNDDGRSGNASRGGRDDNDDGARVRSRPQTGSRPNASPSTTTRRAAPSPPPPPPPPEFARNEIVALALTNDDLAVLTGQGFTVLEEVTVPGVSAIPRRLATPANLTLDDARGIVRALPSGQDADFNHFYRSEDGFDPDCQGADCPARLMIDWSLPESRLGTCGSSVRIGMIDTGINETHDTFDGAKIAVERLSPDSFDASRALHGTAVAALLVGAPGTRSPGLVPGAELVAIDAFYRSGRDERADVFTLVRSLGALAEDGVQIINLSLAGPENSVLAEVVDRLVEEQDVVLVAAVGNSGPRADPEYPAAYDPVIAVTAVDRDGAIYRRAVRGPHVDLAAPGVNIWTAASISGARWKTGTSYAVPFVTAAAAMLRETRPDLPAREVEAVLRQSASDLGDPGADPVFGAGLLKIDGLCADSGGRPSR